MTAPAPASASIGVAVVTHNRRERLLASLEHLTRLPGRPPIVVADDRSTDGTRKAVSDRFPDIRIIAPRATGAAARTEAADALGTDLVAFADDDSWWAPSAFARARAHFARSPQLALLAARVLVGPENRLDPVCDAMATSPLGTRPGLPGPAVLGFVACGAIVRREPFLAVGGFHPHFGIGGEEELLALDLRAAGGQLAYAGDVVAHHHPQTGPRPGRSRHQARNAMWTAWLRRPARQALRVTAGSAIDEPRALAGLLRALPWLLRERRAIPPDVEADVRTLEAAG